MSTELFNYYVKQTNKKLDKIDNAIESIRIEVVDLKNFKFKVIGFAVAVQIIITSIATLIIKTL